MSDGLSDAAAMEHKDALKKAKKLYPELEIVDWDWRNYDDWMENRLNYLAGVIKSLAKKETLEECDQCGGKGEETVVYIHEKHIEHTMEKVTWICRMCYGSGFLLKDWDYRVEYYYTATPVKKFPEWFERRNKTK